MSFRIKAIVPKSLVIDVARLTRVIENTLSQSALAVKADFGVTTQTWSAKSKPSFTIESEKGKRRVFTTGQIFLYVNDGTKPHIIRGKNGKALRFQTGYSAKTTPGQIASGAGERSGEFVRAKQVRHPGTRARGFDEVIKRKWDDELPAQLQRSVDGEV